MKKGLCVYPGSFDPVTIGHLDLIERGADIFPEVVVAVLHNPAKEGCFPIAQRLELLSRACAHLPNVRFDQFDGLLVDYMKKLDAGIVLRGLRAVTDFESEFQMAQLNHQMAPDVETLFMMTAGARLSQFQRCAGNRPVWGGYCPVCAGVHRGGCTARLTTLTIF